MLTAQQKAEAQKKLKNIGQELAHEEQIKSTIKKSTKAITEALATLQEDKKTQLQILTRLANTLLPEKILALDTVSNTLVLLQDKLKTEREKCNRDAILLLEEKQRFEGGIEEIKKTIINIQKTIKESVEEETAKRKKIEDDLETSLSEIRSKITEFETESTQFDIDNADLKEKIEGLKGKLEGIEATFKVKADQKDEEVKQEKEQLTQKLKVLQSEVEKVTELNKEYSGIEKKNFDNKLAFYLKTKKFPQFCSSFESSAKTLDSCKEELLKGVCRMNIAGENIEASQKITSENNILYLLELKRQQQKQSRLEEIKKQKEAVRSRIILLQSRIKQKKAASQTS